MAILIEKKQIKSALKSRVRDADFEIERLGRLTMKDKELWKLFEKTGSINDYLNYACTCESQYEEDCCECGHKEDECFE